MATELDHLVVGCADLALGEAWLTDILGKQSQGGGEHAMMSTHNKVWSLGSAFIELIAINPDAPAIDRPRWFSLDDPATRKKLAIGPHLLTWAIRVDNLEAAQQASPISLGAIHEMERGDLKWKVAIPDDGGLLHDGHVPLVIQWQTPHPAERMDDSGLRLKRFVAGRTETSLVDGVLKAIGADGLLELDSGALGTSLMAEIHTEEGNISLVG